MSIGVLY